MMKPTMQEFARVAKAQLEQVPRDLWAVRFVELRLRFTRLYPHGLLSTSHGIDFFDNVLAGPEAWDEKGEYGKNFRVMLGGKE